MPHSTTAQREGTSDYQFDVVSLETIDFGRLAARELDEINKLRLAAQMPGFFYLDLRGERTKGMLADLRKVYSISEDYFEPNEQQAMFEIMHDSSVRGSVDFPLNLRDHAEFLNRFSMQCHATNKTLLSCLSDAMGLKGEARFENSHRDNEPSDTALNLIYSPAKRKRSDAPDTTHTDAGTLTSLFCDEWGIMIEHPETKTWAYAEPKPGCALVNVADSLQRLSGNKFRSCRHCHTQPLDGFQKRYFVVSYLRPEKAG